MEEIKKEFERYLRDLLAFYKQDDINATEEQVPHGPIGGRSKNYNAHAKDKMYELMSKAPEISAIAMKLELSKLRVKYHRVLIEDYI